MERANIVVLGQFNPGITHPTWLRNEGLVEFDELTLQSPVNTAGPAVPTYTFGPFTWIASYDRLTLETRVADPHAHLDAMARIFDGLFERLPHTPVAAVGFNFVFGGDALGAGAGLADSVFRGDELTTFSAALGCRPVGAEVKLVISRTATDQDAARTQLSLAYDETGCVAHSAWNHHRTVSDVAGARQAVAQLVADYEWTSEAQERLGHDR